MGETDVDRPNDAGGSDDFQDVSRHVGMPQCPSRCLWFVSKDGRGLVVCPHDDVDRDALAEMYRDHDPDARSMGLPSANRAHITERLSNLVDHGRNLVVVADRDITGHAAHVAGDDPKPELVVFVRQDSHDRGIETELCYHVAADAADAGCEAFIFHVTPDNQWAVHVYRELGFETVSSNGADAKMCLDPVSPVPPVVRPTTGTESRG